MNGSEKQAGFGSEFEDLNLPLVKNDRNYQSEGLKPGADQLKKYRDAIEYMNRNTTIAPTDNEPVIVEQKPEETKPEVTKSEQSGTTEVPQQGTEEPQADTQEATNKYVPTKEDLAAFEKAGGVFTWNFNKDTLTEMAATDDTSVKNMSNYLLENFDTVADLTSGGKQNTIGINDIRLVAKAADAVRNYNDLNSNTIPHVLEAFDRLDYNGNGFLSKYEIEWINRDDPSMAALKQNFDLIRHQTDEGKWFDRGISRADLEAFQSKVALKSVVRETHNEEDLDVRSYYSGLAGKLIGVGVIALVDPKGTMSAAEQLRIIGATQRVTTSAVRWYYKNDAAQHYSSTAEPALTKLMKPIGG